MRSAWLAAVLGTALDAPGQSVRLQPAPALEGYVLTPEWLPVASGTVSVAAMGANSGASVEPDGRFRIEGLRSGTYDVSISAPDLLTRRLTVTMPATGVLLLPPIRLAASPFVRVRVLSPTGQPIERPHIARASFSIDGLRIGEEQREWKYLDPDPDGARLVGPLPAGIAVLGVDVPPFARMRLREVRVTGEPTVIDAGTVRVEPGATLYVDLVDGAGRPVPDHDVLVSERAMLSPFWWPPVRTDAKGRASFERLASGRYLLRARLLRRCHGVPLTLTRQIDVPSNGSIHRTITLDGALRLRLTSAGVPLAGKTISLAPEAFEPAAPAWVRRPHSMLGAMQRSVGFGDSACAAATAADGRATFEGVPAGPARAVIRLPNSRWVRRLTVPGHAHEMSLDVPMGVLPVRVVDKVSRAPIAGASIAWASDGAIVEAVTSATGDALLEAISPSAGTLTVEAANYQRAAVKLALPPGTLEEIALEASSMEVHCRVINDAGAPLERAVVELTPHDPLEPVQVATTDRTGSVRFPAPPGGARVTARGGRYVAKSIEYVPAGPASAESIVLTLSRGHRIVVTAEPSVGDGPHAIRLADASGRDMDTLLDAASDRVIAAGRSRASLGPLQRGSYVVELRTGSRARRERVAIDGEDVRVTFR